MRCRAALFCGLIWLALSCGASGTDPRPPGVHEIAGLLNVDNAVAGADAVWVTTSSRSDRFSPEPADASIVRVSTADLSTTVVASGLDPEPTLVIVDDHVWAALDDHVLVYDGQGDEVARIEVDVTGDLVTGDGAVWATGFRGGVSVIDPDTYAVGRRLETVPFPTSPIVAFGAFWTVSVTEHTLTAVDTATLRSITIAAVSADRPTDLTAVEHGSGDGQVWVTDVAGDLSAVAVGTSAGGDVRPIEVDRAINQVIPAGDRIVLLPTWGQRVVILTPETEAVVAEVDIGTIPVRAVVHGGEVWVSGDGIDETVTRIDVASGQIIERYAVGTNTSETTGPTQPIAVDDEVWVPNRGDDVLVVLTP